MNPKHVKVALGCSIPGAEQFSSLRIELASESDVTEKEDESSLRASMIEQLSKELEEWKASNARPMPMAAATVAACGNVASHAISADDPYEILPQWKQSSKRANLSTIMITEETLRNAVIQDLYDKLKLVGSLKVNSVTYKISDFAGKTFLQKWSNPTRMISND